MKYNNIIIILFFSFLFIFSFSCASLNDTIDNEDRVILTPSNFKLIEGKYFIKSIDNRGTFNLDSYILGTNFSYLFQSYNHSIGSDSSRFIIIKVVDDKTLNISYFKGSTTLSTKKIKGKLKNGYFVLKRGHLFIPFIFTNLYRNRQFRMGVLNNGNLITDYSNITFGTVMIIFPYFEKDKDFDIEFKRIPNKQHENP